MKKITAFIAAIIISQYVFAGSAELKGQVKDEAGNPLPFATVMLEAGGNQRGMNADGEGFYSFKPLEAGDYQLTISYIGMRTVVIPNIILSEDDQRTVEVAMEVAVLDIEVDIRPLPEGLFNPPTRMSLLLFPKNFLNNWH